MSVIADFQVSAAAPSAVGGLGTSVKYFPRFLGSSIGVQGVAPSATSAKGQLAVPGLGVLDGQNFEVVVGMNYGSDTGDPSGTVLLGLYAQTSANLASPSYTLIASSGALTPNLAAAEDISMKVQLFGSSKSGIVQGIRNVISQQAIIAATALSANLSGINFQNDVPFGLVVGVTFGTSDATNAARLTQFQVVAH